MTDFIEGDGEITKAHAEQALSSLSCAAEDPQYAEWLKDEFLMHVHGENEQSDLPLEGFIALCTCFRRGLQNPEGRIAELMKKSGFDSQEVLGSIHFDLTPEH